jgi:hypothetical protein
MPNRAVRLAFTGVLWLAAAPWALAWRGEDDPVQEARQAATPDRDRERAREGARVHVGALHAR